MDSSLIVFGPGRPADMVRGSQVADDQAIDKMTHPRDAPGVAEGKATGDAMDSASWANLWQIPAILLSVGLIMLAIAVAHTRSPGPDFDGVLDEVAHKISVGEFDEALRRLNNVIEPNLEQATNAQKARFHALAADWVHVAAIEQGADTPQNHEIVNSNYEQAQQLGLALDPHRLRRWAMSLLAVNRPGAAHDRLSELEAIALAREDDGHAAKARNGVLRMLIEYTLADPDGPDEKLITTLRQYRKDGRLAISDDLWASARLAELRLQAGDAQRAIDHLLLDIRRIEDRLDSEPAANLQAGFGELHTLLARAYIDLGQYAEAQFNVNRALALLDDSNPLRGRAQVLNGRIALVDGRFEDAFEHFDQTVEAFMSTPAWLSALLGRAEVLSVLGEHERSLQDYKRLVDAIGHQVKHNGVERSSVKDSLIDRHDAAVAAGELNRALAYVEQAGRLYPGDAAPPEVSMRLATTHRQLAADLLDEPADVSYVRDHPPDVPPDVRYQAYQHYEMAAASALRHAQAVRGDPDGDEAWAQSLWLAADSFDRAGRFGQAIQHFQDYIANRGETDPRRPEAVFRVAQAHHATLQWRQAAEFYEQLIESHPRSPFATRAHVPLARCYLKIDRPLEAEQQLLGVVTGRHPVRPESLDYRDALTELGRLYYENGDYAKAIEYLDKSSRLYPSHAANTETLYRLADSYRNLAIQIDQQITDNDKLSPSARREQQNTRDEHLQSAHDVFAMVIDAYEQRKRSALDPLQRQFYRNAHLYKADCLFYLGLYENAVKQYDLAARRFSSHHSSMHALVQIVNCFMEMGEDELARSAHRRALVRLRQLPDDAFDAPDALMDRSAWQRWLENVPVDVVKTAAAGQDANG